MKTAKKYSKIIAHLSTLISLFVLSGMFAYLWYSYYIDNMLFDTFKNKGNILVVIIYAVLLYTFSHIYGAYKIGYLRITEIIYSQFLSIFITNVISYCQVMLICRHLMGPLPMIILTGADFIVASLWAWWMNKLYFKIHSPRDILIVYGKSGKATLDTFIHKLNSRPEKFHVSESVSLETGLENVLNRVDHFRSIVIYDVKTETRNKILKFCFEQSKRVYVTPKISDIIMRGADTIELFDTPLLLCKNDGISYEQRFIKRSIDIVISGVMLLLLSPIMLITAIVIKLYDGGPVFFRQDRCTIRGKVFSICKFRSMIVDAEKDGVARLSSKDDRRITPIGKVIRKTRIDELPQLINILMGEMSIVGPRPERPEIVKQYKKDMPEFDYRLRVKGGLTGYAQIAGKYNTNPYDKLKLDLIYIENYSLLLDLKLVFKTVKIMFMKESTEGIENGAQTAANFKHERIEHKAGTV
ncbi:sugar transferase [Caproiciproducens sp. CPB-2]|uniref:sugar transferase n=1 Tax=Caproiciproducens sp. CPB-2 TaxID=3030017 RepID=UPI0023DB8D5A|nr:sugar transferase [Caproiciproducens sp. CPB-2]MDF1494084.1 sugar transferase [Caproiciproducens sp. CPB-2]